MPGGTFVVGLAGDVESGIRSALLRSRFVDRTRR